MTMSNTGALLFGGSFNPPHNGHVAAVVRAAEALGLGRTVIMPAGRPPHKDLPPDTPSVEQRLAMTRLAFSGIAGCHVSAWELNRPGPTYTIETLEQLRGEGLSPVLLVGSDMFLTLQGWVRASDIIATAKIAVLLRDGADLAPVRQYADFLAHAYGATVTLINNTPIVISSTRLRDSLRSGEGIGYLPEAVYGFIKKHGLYGVKAEHTR